MIFMLPDKDTMGLFRAQFWQLAQYSSWAFFFFFFPFYLIDQVQKDVV